MKVLVVAPHPDDEAIGMGGTIASLVYSGHTVEVLYITDGEKGGDADTRITEAGLCSQVLQNQQAYFWHYPDGGLNGVGSAELYDRLISKTADYDLIYGPSELDAHDDHIITGRAVREVCNRTGRQGWAYEVWSPHTNPSKVVDITPYATTKRAAIRCYKSQLQNGFDEGILALNHYRGLLHAGGSGVMYAEAFARV